MLKGSRQIRTLKVQLKNYQPYLVQLFRTQVYFKLANNFSRTSIICDIPKLLDSQLQYALFISLH